jgi:hypothetical protein
MTIIEDSRNYWLISLGLNTIVTSLLIIRFARNIRKLTSRIKSNPVDYKKLKTGLLKRKYFLTLLGTIFINETDYHNRKIEPIIHP